ncbi:MAG: chromosome segregation protein [Sciscionella sp.]
MHAEDTELVPLKAGFDISWRGFNRAQVKQHLEDLAEDMRVTAADRDATLSQVDYLSRSLERARSETEALRKQVDRLCRGPVNTGELAERLKRMMELANAEASDITARAHAAAEHTATSAREAANSLKLRYQRLLTDFEERRREMEAEHKSLMEQARAEVATLAKQAEQRREQLDSDAEQLRRRITEDFQISMRDRRNALDKDISDKRAVSDAEAARLVSEASTEAKRLVSEACAEAERRLATANAQVEERREFRDRLSSQLSVVRELMLEAAPLLQDGAELNGADKQPDAVPAEVTTNGNRPAHDRNAQEKTVQHLTPVPEQQRHSAAPPSTTKRPLQPRPTAGAGSGR